MGQPTREGFREVWHLIQPLFESVMESGVETSSYDALFPLQRFGYVEETYFTFSYSPVRDESSGVAGVLVTCMETTERVIGERRMAAIRELGGLAAHARSEQAVIAAVLGVLDRCTYDIPLAGLYRPGDEGPVLATSVLLSRLEPNSAWPVDAVLVEGKTRLVEGLSIVAGPWPEPCREALLVPLVGPSGSAVMAVLVAGVSPRRALDESYRGFLELVAGHVASALANARAYEAERRRADALAELDRAKTTFFSNVSHEFRTPLALMLAPTEDLLARPDMPGDVRDQLQLVHRNALRLLRLVNTLLDFASLEAGRMMAHYEPQDVASLTTDLASGFRSLMERAGLRYEVQCDSNAGTIWMDRDMWEKIVLNLLSNAYKFTLSGTVNVSLHALPASDAPWAVELAVADTGCGIPQADLPHLFERFHRVSAAPARTHEGTGIGLALVYELIGLHGGELRVESQAGGGSTFRVRLRRGHGHLTITPQAPAPPTRSPAPSYLAEAERWTAADTEGPEPAAVPDGDKPSPARILIADDNRDMRDYVRQLLGATYTVNTVADGQAALEAARRNPPDLILADIMMPLMDGIELVRHMRSDAMLRTIPVILLSARAGEESRVEGLASGADDYLVKPFTARELRARVAAHLSAHQVRRESLLASERDRRHLYDILQRAPAFIATLRGPEHVFEYANELYRKMVAGSRELIGKPLLLALPEIQGQGIVELLDDVYRRGQPYVATELRSVVRPRTDEEPVEFIFNVVFQPMLNEAHQVDAIMLHAVDVSAQVRARREVEALAAALRIHQDNLERLVERRTLELRERTEELTLANQRLQELDRLKTEFVGTMSHELRTPLNAIIGFSEMLRDADLSPDDTREYLEHVCEGGQLLLKLVNQALDFASIEAGHLRLYPTEFRLESLVQDVVNLLSQRARERDVRLAVRAVPTTVTADEDRLGQILINLVANAIKFSPPGSTVQVAMHNDADAVRVQVSDSGAGIHEQDQARIFEPFGPGNTLQRRAGTGLGLTISRRLAEAHGGRIELVSAPNQGSCFILVLPAAGTEM